MVQSITRPMGRALEHATLPYLFTTQGSGSGQQLPFNEQQNANTDKQAQINADTVSQGLAERDRIFPKHVG
jgi:RND superfamily putative drug exporter